MNKLFRLSLTSKIEKGHILEHVQTLVSTEDIHSEFVSAWTRWILRDRILRLIDVYMRSVTIQLPPLDLDSWRRAVRRFRPGGPLRLALEDLLNLPESRTLELLHLLQQVEAGHLS